MDKVVDGLVLLLMCDQVMHAHQPIQTHTYLTYTLRAECVLMLVVLTSTQLTHPQLTHPQLTHPQRDATGVVNIFLECLMQRAGGQRGGLLRALLGHYTDMHHEPSERSPTFGEALSEALSSASPSFSMSSQSLQAWQHGRAVACSSSLSSRGCVLSERCGLLLLVLVNYTHSNAASNEAVQCISNPYRAALHGMHDSDARTSSASFNETIVCYKALHDGVAIGLAHYRDLAIAGRGLWHPGCGGSVMLLYMVMTSSQSFRNMVLAKSEVHLLLEPLLAILYHHTAPATQATPHRPQAPPVASASCYVLLLVLLMLSQDGSYCARLHSHECTLSSVAWYKERHLTKVSLGSLAIIVLTRSAQVSAHRLHALGPSFCRSFFCLLLPLPASVCVSVHIGMCVGGYRQIDAYLQMDIRLCVAGRIGRCEGDRCEGDRGKGHSCEGEGVRVIGLAPPLIVVT